MVRSVTLEEQALLKVILHSLKFPLTSCNGVLVGDVSDNSIRIDDVVPINHTFTSLPGQMELALALIQNRLEEKAAKENQPLSKCCIVGYYQCNDRREDVTLGPVEKKIANKVSSLGGVEGVVVMLDGSALEACVRAKENKVPVLLLEKTVSSQWEKRIDGTLQVPCLGTSDWVDTLKKKVQDGAHSALVDFEDHMEDIRKDFVFQTII